MTEVRIPSGAWVIEATALRQLREGVAWASGRPRALTARPDFQGVESEDPGPNFAPVRAWKVGSVAVLGFYGVHVARDTYVNRIEGFLFGGTILEHWTQALGRLAADPSISGIVLDVDSPGGQVAGTAEAADLVRAVDRAKPVWAYTSGTMASGAYWIGSTARRVVAHPAAELGSIGALVTVVDQDPEWLREHAGVLLNTFVAVQGPNKDPDPNDPAGAELWQDRIDALGEKFVAAVAGNRKVSEAKVRRDFGAGWVMTGSAALEAGMVDQLGTLEDAIRGIGQDPGRRPRARAARAPSQAKASPSGGSATTGRAGRLPVVRGKVRPR
ncbi:S49 family peptidase [Tautonia sp. JC769]|uniref:S49 family peptidase n=1 Tax=Tautonia sp. JC769 TaxID=3232135 RepID=UPI003459D3B7